MLLLYCNNQVAFAGSSIIIAGTTTHKKPLVITNSHLANQLLATGSIFKLATFIAALESGINPQEKILCKGIVTLNGKPFRCSVKEGHGEIDLENALAYSCNLYFAALGKRIGTLRIRQYAKLLGFTPSKDFPSATNYDSLALAKLATGEEGHFITPLQAYNLIWNIANKSYSLSPHTYELLKKALTKVLLEGSAKNAGSLDLSLAGKTGTAYPVYPIKDFTKPSGWFIGYSPADAPKKLIVVFLPHGDGATSAAIAGRYLKTFKPTTITSNNSIPAKLSIKTFYLPAFTGTVKVNLSHKGDNSDQKGWKELVLQGKYFIRHQEGAFGINGAYIAKRAGNKLHFFQEGHPVKYQIMFPAIAMPKDKINLIGSSINKLAPCNGKLFLSAASRESILVINEIPLEQYVEGVVTHEMPGSWEAEVLTAQSIVARSFALANLGRHKKEGFDFCPTTHCQAYRGIAQTPSSIEEIRIQKEVRRSRSMVLTYKGQIAKTYYHSTCKGETVPPEDYDKGTASYLQGVKDPYCIISPFYKWTASISWKELQQLLANEGVKSAKISRFEISKRDAYGRAGAITLYGTKTIELNDGQFLQMAGTTFGWGKVLSPFFKIQSQNKDGVLLEGKGLGHGIGFCQWGAKGLAKQGKGFYEILSFYFPRTTLTKLK